MNYQKVIQLDAQQCIPTMNFFVFTLLQISMDDVWLHTLSSVVLGSSEDILGTWWCCCSVAKLCLTLWDPMVCGTPGLLVLHYPSEFAQIDIQWVGDTV